MRVLLNDGDRQRTIQQLSRTVDRLEQKKKEEIADSAQKVQAIIRHRTKVAHNYTSVWNHFRALFAMEPKKVPSDYPDAKLEDIEQHIWLSDGNAKMAINRFVPEHLVDLGREHVGADFEIVNHPFADYTDLQNGCIELSNKVSAAALFGTTITLENDEIALVMRARKILSPKGEKHDSVSDEN